MRLLACVVLLSACSFRVPGIDVEVAPGPTDAAGPPAVDGAPPPLVDASMPHAPIDMISATSPDMAQSLPPGENVGDACVGVCGGGFFCMPWVLAGYCTKSCGTCPLGSRCADIGGGMHYCLLEEGPEGCRRNDLECRDCGGQVCAPSLLCHEC
jgi:hypothetical protein